MARVRTVHEEGVVGDEAAIPRRPTPQPRVPILLPNLGNTTPFRLPRILTRLPTGAGGAEGVDEAMAVVEAAPTEVAGDRDRRPSLFTSHSRR